MCRELGTSSCGVINERIELGQLKIISSRNYDEGSAIPNGSINEIENCLIAVRKMFTFISNLRKSIPVLCAIGRVQFQHATFSLLRPHNEPILLGFSLLDLINSRGPFDTNARMRINWKSVDYLFIKLVTIKPRIPECYSSRSIINFGTRLFSPHWDFILKCTIFHL